MYSILLLGYLYEPGALTVDQEATDYYSPNHNICSTCPTHTIAIPANSAGMLSILWRKWFKMLLQKASIPLH